MVGAAYFRIGQVEDAEKHFDLASNLHRFNQEAACMGLCNLALLKCGLKDFKTAILKANEGLKLATSLYADQSSEDVCIKIYKYTYIYA